MPEQPNLDRLQPVLLTSGVQKKDPPLYQVINQLIKATKQLQIINSTDNNIINNDLGNINTSLETINNTLTTINNDLLTITNNLADAINNAALKISTYLTTGIETSLPNSRRLLAGTNITFDDSISGERTVNGSAGLIVPGSDKELIFNDGSNLGTDTNLTYNKTTNVFNIGIFETGNAAFSFFGSTASLFSRRAVDSGSGPSMLMDKARGTLETPVIVNNNDIVFEFSGRGHDGFNYQRAIQIIGQIDGTPNVNDMPGRITLLTTSSGSTSVVERMRIDNKGNIGIGIPGLSFGTSAAKILAIGNGVEPTTSPADMIQLYSVDLSAGNATLGLRTERAVVTESVTSDRTLSIRINGTTYKLCLKA